MVDEAAHITSLPEPSNRGEPLPPKERKHIGAITLLSQSAQQVAPLPHPPIVSLSTRVPAFLSFTYNPVQPPPRSSLSPYNPSSHSFRSLKPGSTPCARLT